MGIRNGAAEKARETKPPLITPHGDSEREERNLRLNTTDSHNPSWGFGTHPVCYDAVRVIGS